MMSLLGKLKTGAHELPKKHVTFNNMHVPSKFELTDLKLPYYNI